MAAGGSHGAGDCEGTLRDPMLRLTEPREDVHDALADLFLGPTPKTEEPLPEPTPSAELAPAIEAIVLGHLPGLASAWAGQYARTVAGIDSACVLVSLRGGRISVEVHGVTDAETGGPCKTLDEALGLGRTLPATWLIRDDAGDAVADADSVTLLTGSDDAAIVAAYRELKSIKQQRSALESGLESDTGPLPVRIATPETRDGSAKEKIERLAGAAVSFLGASAETVLIGGLLGGGRRSVIYDGVHDGPGGALIERIRGAEPMARSEPEREREREREPAPEPETRSQSESVAVENPEPEHAAQPAVHVEPAPSVPGITIDDLLDGPTRSVGDPEPEADAAPAARDTLAEHLEGVLLAEARCPFAEEVELGLDAEGRLHLLIAATGAEVAGAIETLESAQAWADEHRSLLKLTSGLGSMRTEHRPVAHLFTDQPRRVRRLLNSATRLHLLHHAATATGESVAVCLELN